MGLLPLIDIIFPSFHSYCFCHKPAVATYYTRREGTLDCLLQSLKIQSLKIRFSNLLAKQLLKLLLSFDWLVNKVECLNVLFTNCNLQEVYHHWGCILIYRPLSYSFRSLIFSVILSRDRVINWCLSPMMIHKIRLFTISGWKVWIIKIMNKPIKIH